MNQIINLIEKYESKIKRADAFINGSMVNNIIILKDQHAYYSHEKLLCEYFITDLKELQEGKK